jgi:hypothetical protein
MEFFWALRIPNAEVCGLPDDAEYAAQNPAFHEFGGVLALLARQRLALHGGPFARKFRSDIQDKAHAPSSSWISRLIFPRIKVLGNV